MLTYLIVCPLIFLGGLVDSIAGGGGLISLPAYLIAGLPVHNSIATNKMSSFMGTSLSTYKYAKEGMIPWKLAPVCVLMAFVGSASGSTLALHITDHYFRMLLLVIIPISAFYIVKNKNLQPPGEAFDGKKTTLIAMATALVVGAYDGFYGPGTGTFLILLLASVARLQPEKANGLSKVINLTTNVAALTVFFLNGKVVLPLGLVAGAFGIAGNYVGSNMVVKGGSKSMRPVMLIVLAIFYIKVIIELF